MKIGPLLIQYFQTAKRLDVPGIGSFHLLTDYSGAFDSANQIPADAIRFENNRATKESPELVNYVSSQTGKIKALATADLDSFWEQARQFLHIGKPFVLDGIGSLTKMQSGEYSYTADIMTNEKLMDHVPGASNDEAAKEERAADYKSILYLKKIKEKNWKRPMAVFLFVIGLGSAIWGGYYLSQRRTQKPINENTGNPPVELTSSESDSLEAASLIAPVSGSIPGNDSTLLKFVIETAEKNRAFKRYDYLRTNGLLVEMETTDSANFRLFFPLRVMGKDSTHILDSLQRFYTPAGKKAFIIK